MSGNGMEYQYHKLQCGKCGRKVLVEMHLFGVPHHGQPNVTCAECLGPLSQSFRQQNPEAAADIEAWSNDVLVSEFFIPNRVSGDETP